LKHSVSTDRAVWLMRGRFWRIYWGCPFWISTLTELAHCFSWSLHTNSGIEPLSGPRPLVSTTLPIYYSLIMQSFATFWATDSVIK
jgi:hypothetical protein